MLKKQNINAKTMLNFMFVCLRNKKLTQHKSPISCFEVTKQEINTTKHAYVHVFVVRFSIFHSKTMFGNRYYRNPLISDPILADFANIRSDISGFR